MKIIIEFLRVMRKNKNLKLLNFWCKFVKEILWEFKIEFWRWFAIFWYFFIKIFQNIDWDLKILNCGV